MEQIQPWFYDTFSCIASACPDTCCAGWEVPIDPESLARYQADSSAFGLHRQGLIDETAEGATFRLDAQERCPFLTEENLCAMILADGEDSLCHICTHHPRFYKCYGRYDEQGIGLSCIEGSRLLLSAPLRFQRRTISGEIPEEDILADTVFDLRALLQEILTDKSLPVSDRWAEAVAVTQEAQGQLFDPMEPLTHPSKETHWQWLLQRMVALEPINQGWQTYVEELKTKLPELLTAEADYCKSDTYDADQWGDVAAYILFRHFPGALWDGLLLPRLLFALESALFVHLCWLSHWVTHGTLTQEDKAVHLKNWSKQVEYSDENTQQFLEDCAAFAG